jgi:ABC-type dipeptide/oligopeptide/nickel transport system permease component
LNFIARRLVAALVTLFLVSVFAFLAFNVIKGDPASLILGTDATDGQIAALRTQMGLDRPLAVRYLSWLGGFFTGKLGNSTRFQGEAISALIADRLPVTFTLAVLSFFLIVIISFPAALFSVKKEGGLADRIMNTLTAINISIPGFFLAVIFIWIFGILLKLFSPGVWISYSENIAGFIGCLFFPALAIAIPNAAIIVKFLRASVFKELRSDYVRTALSKGAARSRVLYGHVLKNAVIPSVTLAGMIVAEVFSGSIVIEQVFTIPGIGRLLIASITSRDYTMVQTLAVYIAFVMVFANTLVDIAIHIIDPRIRFT